MTRAFLRLVLLWSALVASPALAQNATPISLDVNGDGELKLPADYVACGRTVADVEACVKSETACKASSAARLQGGPKLVQELLISGAIVCAKADAKAVALKVTRKLVPTVLVGSGKPLASLKNGLLWSGWSELEKEPLVHDLAALTCTEHTNAGQGNCKVMEVAKAGGGHELLLFTSAAAEDVRIVELQISKGNALTIVVPHCDLTAAGTVRSLIPGAALQPLVLTGPAPCMEALAKEQNVVLETAGGLTIPVEPLNEAEADGQLILKNVPASAPATSTEWKLRSGGVLLGRVTLASAPRFDVERDASGRTKLYVEYGDREVNNLQTGETTSGLAVATNGDVDRSRATAWNVATVVASQDLSALAAELAKEDSTLRQPCGDFLPKAGTERTLDQARSDLAKKSWEDDGKTGSPCADAQDRLKCFDTCEGTAEPSCDACNEEDDSEACLACQCRRERKEWLDVESTMLKAPWRIRARSWDDSVRIEETKDATIWWQDHEARSFDLQSIKIATDKSHQSPLHVQVSLVDPTCPTREFFKTDVLIADRARVESLPLPISDLLFIACGEADDLLASDPIALGMGSRDPDIDSAINGAMRAVDDSQLESGSCALLYEPQLYDDPVAERSKDALADFGPQGLAVSVTRDGAQPRTEYFPILSPDKPARMVLRIPTGAEKGTGPYRVRATLDGAQHPEVLYRPAKALAAATGATGAATTTPGEADGAFAFNATLRPRGASGWRSLPIRTFITFPIQLFGIRMPARGRELTKSSESPSIQSFRPTAGAMFAIEPYDYDVGANPLPVPTQLMTGFHFIDLSQGDLQYSLVTGLSFTFPIIDLPSGTANNQLGTSIAVGAFWELDMQEKFPLRDGNRFIITFGANVLSLFGSK